MFGIFFWVIMLLAFLFAGYAGYSGADPRAKLLGFGGGLLWWLLFLLLGLKVFPFSG